MRLRWTGSREWPVERSVARALLVSLAIAIVLSTGVSAAKGQCDAAPSHELGLVGVVIEEPGDLAIAESVGTLFHSSSTYRLIESYNHDYPPAAGELTRAELTVTSEATDGAGVRRGGLMDLRTCEDTGPC